MQRIRMVGLETVVAGKQQDTDFAVHLEFSIALLRFNSVLFLYRTVSHQVMESRLMTSVFMPLLVQMLEFQPFNNLLAVLLQETVLVLLLLLKIMASLPLLLLKLLIPSMDLIQPRLLGMVL